MNVKKKYSSDQWLIINIAIIATVSALTGLFMFLKDHLEWSWH